MHRVTRGEGMMSAIRKVFVAAAALLLPALVFLATPVAVQAAPPWSDLPDSTLDGYGLTQDDIAQMSEGYPDGTWRPDDPVTRGQFVKLALGCFGVVRGDRSLLQPHFLDVPQASPYFPWVESAFRVGLISGYQVPSTTARTIFGLYDPMTREQAVVVLARVLSKVDPETFDHSDYTEDRVDETLAPFLDEDRVTHRQEVAMAIDVGVLHGSGAVLSPEGHLTRIQGAALIARAQGLAPPPPVDPPPGNPHALSLLYSNARLFDIDAGLLTLGRAAPWLPRTLTVKIHLEAEQDLGAYQDTAELLAVLAEDFQGDMDYEEVRVVLAIPGGAWVYDHTFSETPVIPPYPPMTSAAYHDFLYGLACDGCENVTMKALREDDTWIVRLVIRVEADKQNRETYDAIYDYLTTRAEQYGLAAGENEILRIVLAEATPIPPMGLPAEVILEQRDFGLRARRG